MISWKFHNTVLRSDSFNQILSPPGTWISSKHNEIFLWSTIGKYVGHTTSMSK